MEFIALNQLNEVQKKSVLKIWNKEYPKILSYKELIDFDDYLDKLKDKKHLILLDRNDNIQGWYCDFIRDGERWFALIINVSMQGKKLGTKFLNLAKSKNSVLNAWVMDKEDEIKQNGKIYKSPLHFYLKNEFIQLSSIRLETDKMSAVKIIWNRTN